MSVRHLNYYMGSPRRPDIRCNYRDGKPKLYLSLFLSRLVPNEFRRTSLSLGLGSRVKASKPRPRTVCLNRVSASLMRSSRKLGWVPLASWPKTLAVIYPAYMHTLHTWCVQAKKIWALVYIGPPIPPEPRCAAKPANLMDVQETRFKQRCPGACAR